MSVIITLVASILCKQFSHFGQRLTRLACLPVSSIALMAFIISVRVPRTRDQSPRELRERAALSTSNYSRSERHKVNGEIPFDCIFHFYLESRYRIRHLWRAPPVLPSFVGFVVWLHVGFLCVSGSAKKNRTFAVCFVYMNMCVWLTWVATWSPVHIARK